MNNGIRFIKTAIIYFFGNIFTKMISIFLLPIYTSKINPEQFGYYDLVNSILSLIIPIVFFQIWDGVFRFSFDSKEKENKECVISNGAVIFGAGIIIYIFIYFSIYKYIEFSGYIFFSGLIMGMNYFYSFTTRAYMDNKLFVVSGFINSIVNMVINIILILIFKMDIRALYIATILSGIIQNILIEIKLGVIKKIKYKYISKDIIKSLLKFSLPIGIATVSYWLLSGYTRVIIARNYGVLENGLYAVGNRFCGVILLMTNVLQFAWNEIIYINANKSESKFLQEKAINLIFKLALLISPMVLLLIKAIYPYFVLDVYFDSIYMIPIIFLGVLFNALASFLGTLFLAEKKSGILSTSTIGSAIVNIICTMLFINIGLYGPIIALAVGFLYNLLVRIVIINKKEVIRIDMKMIIINTIVLLGGILIFYISNKNLEIIFLIVIMLRIVYEMKKNIKDMNLDIREVFRNKRI